MLAPPFPLNPLSFLLFPLVGMAERPIPDETRLKPEPPGLGAERLGNQPRWKVRILEVLTVVVDVEASIPQVV